MSRKDNEDREMIMQLTMESDGSAILRTQVRGQEPKEMKGTFTVEQNVVTIVDGEDKLVLGEIASAETDKLIIKQEGGNLTYSKI